MIDDLLLTADSTTIREYCTSVVDHRLSAELSLSSLSNRHSYTV